MHHAERDEPYQKQRTNASIPTLEENVLKPGQRFLTFLLWSAIGLAACTSDLASADGPLVVDEEIGHYKDLSYEALTDEGLSWEERTSLFGGETIHYGELTDEERQAKEKELQDLLAKIDMELVNQCEADLRQWLDQQALPAQTVGAATSDERIDIGDRRELFIDDYLIDSMGAVNLVMHKPQRKNVAIKFDQPWEGPGVSYVALLQEKDKVRMYYKIWKPQGHLQKIMVAESADGIIFTRPKLGLFKAPETGTSDNNIVLHSIFGRPGAGDFSPFLDTNPKATPDAKYKAVGGRSYSVLCAFKSPAGIRWSVIGEKPLNLAGFFDTQNIAFWSEHEQKYVLYYRVAGDEEGNMYSLAAAEDVGSALRHLAMC